tara:strand:+ start:309 stop:449 length:141 start_codon:yes stop_codon:yes gene_type:complete
MYKCEKAIWEKAHSFPKMDGNLKKVIVMVLMCLLQIALFNFKHIFY